MASTARVGDLLTAMQDVTLLILAGGAGRRMEGQDKAWLEINGQPLIEILLTSLRPQCAQILISANRNIEKFSALGAPVVTDEHYRGAGPLAGIYNALAHCTTPNLITVAVDTPGIPANYVSRFMRVRTAETRILVAHDGVRTHPACALLASDLRASLGDFLQTGGRRVQDWQHKFNPQWVDFSDAPDSCYNINTPDDLAHAIQHFGARA
ncbi:MAG: molybdenum cofactor guanylyltransferase MobA [Pseudomonadota bacterium]